MSPEDLVRPGQVEEVVHFSLALWQVDAQAVPRGDIVRLRCRRRRGRVLHDSLIMLPGNLSFILSGIRSLLKSEYHVDYHFIR